MNFASPSYKPPPVNFAAAAAPPVSGTVRPSGDTAGTHLDAAPMSMSIGMGTPSNAAAVAPPSKPQDQGPVGAVGGGTGFIDFSKLDDDAIFPSQPPQYSGFPETVQAQAQGQDLFPSTSSSAQGQDVFAPSPFSGASAPTNPFDDAYVAPSAEPEAFPAQAPSSGSGLYATGAGRLYPDLPHPYSTTSAAGPPTGTGTGTAQGQEYHYKVQQAQAQSGTQPGPGYAPMAPGSRPVGPNAARPVPSTAGPSAAQEDKFADLLHDLKFL